MVAVVQLVEHQIVILDVAGSSPVSHPEVARPGPHGSGLVLVYGALQVACFPWPVACCPLPVACCLLPTIARVFRPSDEPVERDRCAVVGDAGPVGPLPTDLDRPRRAVHHADARAPVRPVGISPPAATAIEDSPAGAAVVSGPVEGHRSREWVRRALERARGWFWCPPTTETTRDSEVCVPGRVCPAGRACDAGKAVRAKQCPRRRYRPSTSPTERSSPRGHPSPAVFPRMSPSPRRCRHVSHCRRTTSRPRWSR